MSDVFFPFFNKIQLNNQMKIAYVSAKKLIKKFFTFVTD